MDAIKNQLQDSIKTGKFEGLTVNFANKDSRLHVTVQATGSIDLPGDFDAVAVQVLNLVTGKSSSVLAEPS